MTSTPTGAKIWQDVDLPTLNKVHLLSLSAAEQGAVPVRIQRKRTKGWKMPPNSVYVGRPSKWGNPYFASDIAPDVLRAHKQSIGLYRAEADEIAREIVVAMYREDIADGALTFDLSELRGKTLACWCRLDQSCHADVLLELANGATR